MRFRRRHRRMLVRAAAAALAVALLALAAWRLTRKPPPRPPPPRTAADVLCDPTSSPEARTEAARELARQGRLEVALERTECVPAGRSAGLAMLAFVFDKACAFDACLGALLHAPRDPETVALAQSHREQLVQALTVRSCELDQPGLEALVRTLIGPAGAVVSAVARGELPDAVAPVLHGLLESRDPAAVRLLHAVLSTPFCDDERVQERQALAGLVLEALRVDEPDPLDLPVALKRVQCGSLLLLVPRLHLDRLPRLADAAPSLVGCERAPRALRARALGYAGSQLEQAGAGRADPAGKAKSAPLVRALDRKQKAMLALPPEASAPAAALLAAGKLLAVAYTTGPEARVCGLPALAAFDEQGRRRVELDPSGIRFFDARGAVRVRLEARSLRFYDGDGREAARVDAGPDRGVRLIDAAGRLRAHGAWEPESLRLRLADGEQTVAQLICDARGPQLQVGGLTLEALAEGAPCRPPPARAGETARFQLVSPRGAFALDAAAAQVAPLELDDRSTVERLEESWESPGLRLSGSGPAARAPAVR